MRAFTSFLAVSPLLALFAAASPSPDLMPRTYNPSQGCSGNYFVWDNDCCPKGGPSKTTPPPQGLSCPTKWYWGGSKGKCYPTQPNPPTPTCGSGYGWDSGLKCCKKSTPPPPPIKQPSPPKPSNKPQPQPQPPYGGGNNGGHNGGGYNGGGSGYNGGGSGHNGGGYSGGGGGWGGKSGGGLWGWKRGLDWDNSFCPSGLATCPIIVNGALSTENECIDTRTDLISCGGCASLEQGRDCTKIANATVSSCQESTCIVEACAAGFTPSSDDSSCIPL